MMTRVQGTFFLLLLTVALAFGGDGPLGLLGVSLGREKRSPWRPRHQRVHLSLAIGATPLDYVLPSSSHGRSDLDEFIRAYAKERDLPPLTDLGEAQRIVHAMPQFRRMREALTYLGQSGREEREEQILSWMEDEPGVWMVAGLTNLGANALYDRVSGKIFLEARALEAQSSLGIGPPGASFDASARISLAGSLLHEIVHGADGGDESSAYAEEEAFYRTLLATGETDGTKEGARRALYLFYGARHRETGAPIPEAYRDAVFSFGTASH